MKRIAWVALLAVFALGSVKGAENARGFTDWSPAANLGPVINGPFGDSCVAISKDGLSLFFSSNRQSPGTTNRDLYVSTRQSVDDPWELPIPLTMLNSNVWDSCPALSPDEHRLYFTTQRPPSCGQDDIWVSRRQDRRDNLGWEPPESLGCEDDGFLNGPGRDLTPTIFEGAAGTEIMYFARTEGVDVYKSDHYESVMEPDGTFGVPAPIHELNSEYAELGITVRRDGLEAFLLSTRPGGSGVTTLWDFWRATRASTRDSWSVPAFVPSLGNPALASGRIDRSFDGSELYFTSQRGGGFGMADLWVARREQVRGPKTK
jgi:hypothetical protein